MENVEPKKRGRPPKNLNKSNSNAGNPALTNKKREYSSALIELQRLCLTWKKVDLSNFEETQNRILDYFNFCAENELKPGVEGLSSALGVDRRRLWEIKNDIRGVNPAGYSVYDQAAPEVRDLIKQSYRMLATLWESDFQSGKLNPASGCFIAKNHFGYRDSFDYNIAPQTGTDQLPPEALQRRLNDLPD